MKRNLKYLSLLLAALLLAALLLAGCNKDDNEPDFTKNITARFDRKFALRLEETGYISNAEKIMQAEVKDITKLDVSGTYVNPGNLTSLSGIEYFEALDTLYCNSNQLTSLDVSKNRALIFLSCIDNQLTSLDISNNIALKGLRCYYNPGNGEAFPVTAWFDNSNIPAEEDYLFTVSHWVHNGKTIGVEYVKVD